MNSRDRIIFTINKGFKVSKDGLCYNKRGYRVGYIHKSTGYYKITIYNKGKHYTIPIHRIQAYQKFGNNLFKDGIIVRHLNNNKIDNSYDNISIGTYKENVSDLPYDEVYNRCLNMHKKGIAAARKVNTKFNTKKRKEIYRFYIKCKTNKRTMNRSYIKTMDKFNILSRSTLHVIINENKN